MLEARTELDVRTVPPAQRHPRIFQAFDALTSGEALVLISDHYPAHLLQQFQAEREGRFEWNVLERGPERFRTEIVRREAEGPRGVFEYLESDHRRLGAILDRVTAVIGSGAFADAPGDFADFACGLDRHIRAEEEVLFPTFEEATGMTAGPTRVMREEHTEIRRLIGDVTSALTGMDAGTAHHALAALRGVLTGHDQKEESVLYPVADQMVGGVHERDDLVRRLQAI